jgi:hypothetical protein
MFSIHMPLTFKIGDTVSIRINAERRKITWRDQNHLVIEPDDVRKIQKMHATSDLRLFLCDDAEDPGPIAA